jgi:hypothetical protein
MKLRWKHLLGLGAAAVAFACLTPDALATGANIPVTDTYSAQTVAITGGSVAITSSGPASFGSNTALKYLAASGQFSGAAAGAAGDVITFMALTAGATFTGAPVAICTPACPATTTLTTAVAGNQINVTVTSTLAGPVLAVPAGTIIALVASATAPAAGTFLGPAVTLNGMANLQIVPPTSATAGLGAAAPTVVLGTANPAGTPPAFPNALGVGQIPNIIQASATCTAGAVLCGIVNTADFNPVVVMQLASANSFALATAPNTQLIDLSGAGGTAAGTQFQTVSGGAASTTTAGFLGLFSLQSSAALLDARFGNPCCNNSGNTVGGNTPLAGTANVAITGDFQTILAAYLRQGPLISQGAQPVEQNPTANGTCTPATAAGDIITSPLPAATGQQTLTFVVPSPTNTLSSAATGGAATVNVPVYAICVITNGSNVIADTLSNSPSTAPAQSAAGGLGVGAGTNWTVTVSGLNFPNLVLARNTHPGFDIAYAGTKVVFTNVFPASSGFPTFFRLVNTGVGTFPLFAVIQRDGIGPTPIPGSFGAMTPFQAFVVSADSIAFQGGTSLAAGGAPGAGPHNTIILLTPATSLLASKIVAEPSGDLIITGPGL